MLILARSARWLGLTNFQNQFAQLKYDAQNGVCYICKLPEVSKRLAVDHCHKSVEMKIRKLLCWRCNTVLGKVEENTEILKQMIEYIEQHKEK